MNPNSQIAEQFREIFLTGEWVVRTNYKAELSELNWIQATTPIGSFNTIAEITFHVYYYIAGILNVFKEGKLEIRDKYSFDMEPLSSQEEWENLLNKMWKNAEELAEVLENISNERLDEIFIDEKYGTYHRNIDALIEHGYYHLGQIKLLKKMIAQLENT